MMNKAGLLGALSLGLAVAGCSSGNTSSESRADYQEQDQQRYQELQERGYTPCPDYFHMIGDHCFSLDDMVSLEDSQIFAEEANSLVPFYDADKIIELSQTCDLSDLFKTINTLKEKKIVAEESAADYAIHVCRGKITLEDIAKYDQRFRLDTALDPNDGSVLDFLYKEWQQNVISPQVANGYPSDYNARQVREAFNCKLTSQDAKKYHRRFSPKEVISFACANFKPEEVNRYANLTRVDGKTRLTTEDIINLSNAKIGPSRVSWYLALEQFPDVKISVCGILDLETAVKNREVTYRDIEDVSREFRESRRWDKVEEIIKLSQSSQ